MKNLKLAAAAGLFALVLAGCGQGAATETTAETAAETTEAAGEETAEEASAEESEETSAEAETDEADGQETSGEAEETEAEDGAEESAAGGYEDNFSVDSQAAADFAVQVQAVVASDDLQGLADLTAYPVYVGIGEGQAVESEEDFLALDPAEVFTDELKSAVAAADSEALEPSEAGFVLSDENGKPNIIFGVVDGELAVKGINY